MKKAIVLAGCLLLSSLLGGTRKGPPSFRAQSLSHLTDSVARGKVRDSMRHGGDLFGKGRYTDASTAFQATYLAARSQGFADLESRALGNLGACQQLLHLYQDALRSYSEARRLSESGRDAAETAVWDADIASLYSDMGEYDAAAQWVEQSLRHITGRYRARYLPQLQILMASFRAHQGRLPEAIELFRQGIEGADRAGNLDLYTTGWNRLGEAFLAEGDLPHAETSILAAYYTRKLHHLPLDAAYRSLGRLRLAQGDLPAASVLLDRAVELAADPRGLTPTWQIYQSRGLVRLNQGRLRDALDDLRAARRLGRAWRWAAPSDDAAQVSTEAALDEVFSPFIEAGNRLYLETRDPALLRETFNANEENRAASLRTLLREAKAPEPAPRYWEALSRLQRAEVAALRNQDTDGLEAAQAELVREEASFAPEEHWSPADLAESARRLLEPDQVLFSFHLGYSISWVWALDRSGLAVYALPPRNVIESQVNAMIAAAQHLRPNRDLMSASLYRTLFGPIAPRFRKARHWLLALDDTLFDVPIPALVETIEPAPVYLVEEHTIERIPGTGFWVEAAAQTQPALSPLFLGVGDPIYNHADGRMNRSFGRADALALPRLVGSASEVEACARAWPGPSVLLQGGDVTRENLIAQLQRNPSAVHLATHYLESPSRSRDGLIALSLSKGGDSELLTPFEISRWRIHTGLVVLSGCHSAVGVALPGTGVLGLTRAWLAAGAQAVVASLWDVPDDDGTFFRPFYEALRAGRRLDAPEALRAAQLQMIHSGGPLARPAYWAAYFVVGNPGKAPLPQ